MRGSKILLSKKLALSALMAALIASPVFADEAKDVRSLMSAGKLEDASAQADAYLAKHPRHAQMQFLKGLILTEQNRPADAISAFEKLTADYPNLPEPYNNLAALYATVGQFDKARTALETAIRHKPDYATAHENLGDVYAKLATQSYDKVIRLDPGNTNAKFKQSLIRAFNAATGGNAAETPKSDAAPTQAAAAAAAQTTPAPPAAVPATNTKYELSKAEPKQETPSKTDSDAEYEAVFVAVNNWASAWSARDVAGYLNAYSPDFDTPHGESRAQWEEGRRARIENKKHIEVTIESPQIVIRGNEAKVKFRQIYKSDRLTSKDRKTLVLEKSGDKWLIKKEYQHS